MSKLIENEQELQKLMASKDGVFVLFYASWCPFSQRFLPIFEKQAQNKDRDFVRFLVEDGDDVCEKHNIEVYPTVLYFKDGKVSKRLDGGHHVGLSERQLAGLMESCGAQKK